MAVSPESMNQAFGPGVLARRTAGDWIWAVVAIAAAIGVYLQYGAAMDGYDTAILIGVTPAAIVLGWFFRPFRIFLPAVGVAATLAIVLYGNDLAAGESRFLLNYALASQSAIMWMSALFVLATAFYFLGLFSGSGFATRTGGALTWFAAGMGLVGLLVRWHETYLVDPAIGYIPVANLYEVFVLFCVTTALLWMYYERRYSMQNAGGFVLLVISAAVAFLLWYSFDRGAHEIEPLVPALNSYWMKLHVPTNFIAYGAFSLAAMTALAYLVRARAERRSPNGLLATRLPGRELLDDLTYKAIALGFIFFTIATILGAVWAAEAWGGYWTWDPKETWSLIVWLNYAGWLHMRLTKGWHGVPMAWWSIVGFFVTLFCFLGVNMFLAGLHSYGEL